MLDLSSRKVYGALAEQCVGGDAKADKVENATSGHLAGLDSNGNLTDSGVSPTEEVTVEGKPVTFDSPFEQDAKSVVVSVKPIQAGSGTPSPENIRPISGIDEVKISVNGKNRLPLTVEKIKELNGTIAWTGNTGTFWGATVTILTDSKNNVTGIEFDGNTSGGIFYLYEGSFNSGDYVVKNNCNKDIPGGSHTLQVIADSGSTKYYVGTNAAQGFSVVNNLLIMLAFGQYNLDHVVFTPLIAVSTETNLSFEPYNPNSHTTTIPLPSTLYDADVDVTEGDAAEEFISVDSTLWTEFKHNNGYKAYMAEGLPLADSVDAKNISNMISVFDFFNSDNMNGNVIQPVDINGKAYMSLDENIDPTTVQFCYKKVTPTTISFAPTDVELLEGTNVVSTNGEKVAVTYKAGILATLGDIDDLNDKVKTKFDKKDVAKVEGTNASKPYAVGDYMLRSDGFYVVTQAIAQNAPITSNNTEKTTVGNELSNKVDTNDSRLSDARTPVAHTHNISDITGIPAWTKLGEVTGTSPDYEDSSTFNLSALQNKDVLMIFSVDEGTLTAKQGIITLEYSAFEFGKILEDSVQEEDEITRLWKGFYGGAPRQSVATFEEFLRGLGYVYIATHSTTAEIGAKIYGAYDWTLEIYTK